MPEALARTHARFVSGLEYQQLPSAAVDKLKGRRLARHVRYPLVGAQTAHGKAAIELVNGQEANHARLCWRTVRGPHAVVAAFANSKLMHATNQTDS